MFNLFILNGMFLCEDLILKKRRHRVASHNKQRTETEGNITVGVPVSDVET